MDGGADLAVLSGSGKLPLLVKKCYKEALSITFNGLEEITENNVVKFEFEKLGSLLIFWRKTVCAAL